MAPSPQASGWAEDIIPREGVLGCCEPELGSPGGCQRVAGLVPPLPGVRAGRGTARHPGVVLAAGKVSLLQGTTIICFSALIFSV